MHLIISLQKLGKFYLDIFLTLKFDELKVHYLPDISHTGTFSKIVYYSAKLESYLLSFGVFLQNDFNIFEMSVSNQMIASAIGKLPFGFFMKQ